MALVLANGQLAASSGTVLGAAADERVVAITLFNTSATEQTAVLTVTHAGTSVTVARVTLERYEALYVFGLALDPSSVLAGYSTTASAVDYLVMRGAGTFSIQKRDADGNPKSSSALEVSLPDDGNLSAGDVKIIGHLEEIRDLLVKIS